MSSIHHGWVVVATTTCKSESREWQVVLAAVGISSTVSQHDGHWQLAVVAPDSDRAIAELEEFRSEVAASAEHNNLLGHDDVDQLGGSTQSARPPGSLVGIAIFLSVIVGCYVAAELTLGETDWFVAAAMNAGAVRAGELWRAMTALMLHRDIVHLLSNAVYGSLFGYLASRNVGGGAAWLAILVSGTLGNLLNGLTRNAAHTSVGVSTAVFGALGLLMTQAIEPRAAHSSSWRRWSPLVGGAILFLYLGIGDEQTDTAAHFYGLISGLLVGGAMRFVPRRQLTSVDIQFWCGLTALALIAAAWSLAIMT